MAELTFEAVRQMTYEDFETIADPMELTTMGLLSPLLVAYVVRTGQLELRYAGIALPDLLDAINNAGTMIPWCPVALRSFCAEQPVAVMDAYLDRLQEHVSAALRPH